MNEEKNELSPKEIYDLKKEEKIQEKQKDKVKEKIKDAPNKIWRYAKYVLITIVIVGIISWLISLVPILPPTSAQNHSEDAPVSHIVTTQLPDPIQRHMLEHSDGNGVPGVIIQYNCDGYDCAPDLVERLTVLVGEYPENVYLAPSKYDGKIILTKVGRKLILDTFDEQKIRNFIEK